VRGAAALLFASALAAFSAVAQSPALSPRQLGEDFDAMWRAIDEGYAYFDGRRGAWKGVREAWRPKATRSRDRAGLLAVLEGALAELGDDHASLSEASRVAPRRLATESDIWARWRDGAAVVEAVRTFGDADVAGLRPGHVISKIQGVDIERAVAERLRGRPMTAASRDRALMQLLAGPRTGTFRLEVRGANRPLDIERLDTPAPREPSVGPSANGPPLVARRMGDERDQGYIRLRNRSAPRLLEAFDAALHYLSDTRALILDLRETPGPASRAATQAILARFVERQTPWQMRVPRVGPRITDSVAPAASAAYRAPLVVLVDRWTSGEAEALAAGLQAAARARLVGTPMAGLRGELREAALPHSGLKVRFPGEKTFLPDGTPREALRPQVPVDLAAPSGGPGDPILYQALKLLEKR
jgi:carboxyl-terminal processing protease